ncbi:MAG: nucleotidyltransferase family protein [Methanothrix sp.]
MTMDGDLGDSYINNEIKILLSCSGTHIVTKRAEKINRLLNKDINWDMLLDIANLERMLPLLYRNLVLISPKTVPLAVMTRLRNEYLCNSSRNLLLTRELLFIIENFDAKGIPIMPFKGPVLAEQVYGDIALRSFIDLDLLIPEREYTRAEELLQFLGYLNDLKLTPAQNAAYLKSEHHHHFGNNKTGTSVELHWRISTSLFSLQPDLSVAWNRAGTTTVLGKKVPSFSPEDTLLVLCEHGARHQWSQLSWIYDIAGIVETKKINLPCLIEQVRQIGKERPLLLGLLLAGDLLDTDLSAEIYWMANGDKAVRANAEQVKTDLFTRASFGESNGHNAPERMNELDFYSNLMSRHQLLWTLLRAFTPREKDVNIASLPDALFPLYYIVRPLRLIKAHKKSIRKFLFK